jgi:hypothetical protein
MDAFSYLSVLLSIIIGLAITQVLQGYRALLLARHRVRPFAPTIIWSGLILVLATQSWWSSFGLNGYRNWTFGVFGVILFQTVLLYMMAALVLPDAGLGEVIDLRAHYEAHSGVFFGILLAMLATSLLKDALLQGWRIDPLDLGAHAVFIAMTLWAIRARNPSAQLNVITAAVLILCYIAILFRHLRG